MLARGSTAIGQFAATTTVDIGSRTASNVNIVYNNDIKGQFSSTGLAVTGALSSTTGANFATSSGNVGIGTASPAAKLDVVGTGKFSDVLTVKSTSATPSIWSGSYGGAISILGDNSTSNRYIDLSIVDSTGALATQGLRIVNSGNVGIGTTSPDQKLMVNINTTSGVNGTVLNSYPIAKFINTDSGSAQRGLEIGANTGSVSSPIYLKVSGTSARFAIVNENNVENFTILSAGNVGIGTSSPSQKLTVIGDVAFRGSSSNADATNIPINLLFSKSSGSSATANLSVTTDFTFTGANSWRNCVLTTTASHINAYGGSQGAVEELIHFRTLNSSPGISQINVIRTNTNGSTITLTYSAPSNGVLRVVATFNDTAVPGSVPNHELWVNFSMLSPIAVTVA